MLKRKDRLKVMTLLSNDPYTQLAFSVYENKGVFAVLLGSGLSHAAEIPTGWEITVDLIRRAALAQGEQEQADWAKWYRDKTGKEPNYSALLEELALSPDERRAILHSYIEPSEDDRAQGRRVPTKAHVAIADLVSAGYVRVIITTNFDRLMENALRERGVEPTVVASVDALAGAEPITHSTCYILKLHGDYKDARILNTDAELSAYPPEYDRLLDRIFDEYGLIIAGWSGEWDHALRRAFLRAPNRRYTVYWAARGSIGAGAQELVDHRRARIIPITDADSFFIGLQQRVKTLIDAQRQNPLSIDLLVSSAKRYLSRSEYRIQLDELLTQEADRLIAKLDADELAPHATLSQKEFQARVRIYESATEPLAKIAGVLGRWGGGSELPLVLDIIRALYTHAEKVGSGLQVWLNIRSYPSVLIFTAYGLGLTRAQRWATLHQLFSAHVARRSGDPDRMVGMLFLWGWKGDQKEWWQTLDGLERHHTPLSDHLCTLLTEWGKNVTGLTPDYELLFDRFEVLGSLAHLGTTAETDLELKLGSTGQDALVWMPVGRVSWHSNGAALAQELQSEAMKSALVSARFASSEKFIELFLTNLPRVARRIVRGW
jgi:hypothetical protein